MKDNSSKRKIKQTRSSSNSPVFTISDDDSPKQSTHRKRKSSEERQSYRKHHKHNRKHHRHRSSDSSGGDEVKAEYQAVEKDSKLRERSSDYSLFRVKEEPLSENERERKHKRHNDHSRVDDSSHRNDSRHHRDDFKRKTEYSEARGTNSRGRASVPAKEETRSDAEPEWGKKEPKKEKNEPAKNNAKPDFGLSGKLTEDANTFNGVVIKYSEPPEARKPKRRWRLYPFKGETSLSVLHIHRQSAYLMGRDRKVADIPIDHPSCSKQHAALQYRLVPFTRNDGSKGRQIKLYVIDLESANGTFLNNNKIEPKKYYELKERDVIKFGFSSREYVLLHEHSKDSENDDDVNMDE